MKGGMDSAENSVSFWGISLRKILKISRRQSLRCSGAKSENGTSYYLEYKKKVGSRGRAKVSGCVDFDLPAGEKCSWWRLDGYDTCGSEAGESDADPQAPLDEEMGVDLKEEGHRSDMELSLSNSDLD